MSITAQGSSLGTGMAIAVTGIGCRLPDARDHREYAANLLAGRASTTEISPDRWDPDRFYSPDVAEPGKTVSKWCGQLAGPYDFDHAFFRVSPREAALMDPQQRLLLEETWHCVEDAGIPLDALRAARTAVYVGAMARDHLQEAARDYGAVESHSGLGGYDCLMANRLSHTLGLRGPSVSVDAACASSLVAVHMAMQALLGDEADFALAGGVSLNLHPWKYISFSKARMLSPTGLCRTFSQDADGYVPGDGVGMVLLRRLDDALRAGDHVYGVLTGSAVNHGGSRATITAPTVASQREVVSAALARAGADPRTITYIEAHGTGTSLGDPIEVEALRQVYAAASPDQGWCRIGSVKPNIGHLEAAAGVAGLIKVLMMTAERRVPPSIHISALNPLIKLDGSPFRITRRPADWLPHEPGAVLRAGVSSFGMGGVNCHVIVEEYAGDRSPGAALPTPRPKTAGKSRARTPARYPFLLSARSPEALDGLLGRWRAMTAAPRREPGPTADICHTLAVGRDHAPVRVGGLVSGMEDIAALVAAPAVVEAPPVERRWRLAVGPLRPPSRQRVRELLASPLYADLVAEFRAESGDAAAALRALRQGEHGPRAEVVFSLLTVRALLRIGMAPDGVTAHGPGVWPALAAVGALDWPAAVDLAEGGSSTTATVEPRAPRLPFTEPLTGRTYPAHPLDTAYLADLLEGLVLNGEETAAVWAKAGRLVDGQHTFRGHLRAWNQELERCGRTAWQLPMDGAAWATPPAAADRPAEVFRVLAAQHALDLLDRKWSLPRDPMVRDPRAREVLELLADGVLTRGHLPALLADGPGARAAVVSDLRARAVPLAPDGDYTMLRARAGMPAGPELLRAWAATTDLGGAAEAPPETATLWIGAPGTTGPADVVIDGGRSFADLLAESLLRLWLGGVEVDWSRYHSGAPRRALSLPTTEFLRSTHRATRPEASPPPEAPLPDATPPTDTGHRLLEATARWTRAQGTPSPAPDGPVLVVLPDRLWETARPACGGVFHGSGVRYVRLAGEYRDDGGVWSLRPDAEEDWQRLFTALHREGHVPRSVVHVVMPDGAADAGRRLAETVHAAFHLVRQLVLREGGERCLVLGVRPAVPGVTAPPEAAAVTGMARSLRRETSRVRMRSVVAGRAVDDPVLWRLAAREFALDTAADAVRYEDGVRQEERFEESPFPAGGQSGHEPHPAIRSDGLYLVTGGAGGLGRLVARHLLRTPGTRVVLIGRSAPGDRESRLHQLVATAPGRVDYLSAELSDQARTDALVAEIRRRHGRLTGVLHAAGVLSDRFLRNKTLRQFRDVLAPKTLGTLHLDRATREERLDFFALFSSVVAVAGNAGQTDYAAANAYLDAYAADRERRRAAGEVFGRTISIGWPLWQDGGMAVADEVTTVFRRDRGLAPLPAATGLAALEELLAGPGGHRVLVYGEPGAAAGLLTGEERPVPTEPAATPAEAGQLAVRYAVTLFSNLLGVPEGQIDTTVGFDEYGIDSITIGQFNAQVERELGPIPHTLLFECRTVDQVAEALAGYHPAALATRHAQPTPPRTETPYAPAVGSDLGRVPDPGPAEGAIAVIGMAGRYPMADDLAAFWDNLRQGRNCVTEVPPSRWDAGARMAPGPDGDKDTYCRWGAFLDDVDAFDPLFFSISPREAELMDPQERLFLQTAWTAFEDAGHPPRRLGDPDAPHGRSVGVFVGVTTQTYQLWGPDHWRAGGREIPTSTQWSIANRVSYWLDLRGPSMPVDTACAASLNAVHLACESLRRRECRMALVGGVNLYLHPSKYDWLCQMNMLSRTGRCHTFGADADGFVPGEGVGALILKPLRDAIAEGDRIHAVIRGTAVNHGGRTNGFTVPNPRAQADLVGAALSDADVTPSTVGYVETHGTGTPLGDPIEIAGLNRAFADGAPGDATPGDCALGSVKTNIGHLEAAAGIAGLTKVLLQLRHRRLVPSLHAEPVNPRIDLASGPFRIQRHTTDWPVRTAADGTPLPRRAGVSAFGAGGSNAHVIVEEYTGPQAPRGAPDGTHLVVVSAKNAERLGEHCAALAVAVKDGAGHIRLSEVAYQLQVRRQPLPERLAVLATDLHQLADTLTAAAQGSPPAENCWTTDRDPQAGRPPSAASRETVQDALHGGDLPALAAAWVSGADIPWEELHDGPLHHVELPGYPFARERHWIRGVEEAAVTSAITVGAAAPHPSIDNQELRGFVESLLTAGNHAKTLLDLWAGGGPGDATTAARGQAVEARHLHPLVHENVSDFREERFRSRWTGQEFLLRDHLDHGRAGLPATAWIEAARVAVALAHGQDAGHLGVRLSDLTWHESHVHRSGDDRPVNISLVQGPDGLVDFDCYQQERVGRAEDVRLYCQGQAALVTPEEPDHTDPGRFTDGTEAYWSATDIEAALSRAGLRLGTAYQALTAVRRGEAHLLAELSLPEALRPAAGRAGEFAAHPVLLTAALQAAAAWPGRERFAAMTPVGIDEVTFHGRCEGDAYAILTAGSAAQALDLDLRDRDGRLLVRLSGIRFAHRKEGAC
ncbi:SDR family NAD(P)-dependent oxidoreductase [Streptomyces sp. LZ34]